MHGSFVKGEKDNYTEEIERLEDEHTKYLEFEQTHKLTPKQFADKKAIYFYTKKLEEYRKFANDSISRDAKQGADAQLIMDQIDQNQRAQSAIQKIIKCNISP